MKFDYIIVGAGSSGCVLANQLSADPSNRVCLLEAGRSDDTPMIRIPAGILGLLTTRKYNWYFDTEPQAALEGRRLYWPRGKALGGSSSINAMVYIRGHAADYDAWAAAGNAGWAYKDLLPLFKAHEHNERGASVWHATNGPLNVADVRSPNPLSGLFVEAAVQAGLSHNIDFNGPQQEGAGAYQVTQKNGERWNSARAFLHPAMQRPNLTVLTGAHVTRILFAGKQAVGVEFQHQGERKRFDVEREIVLSGGAINSPQVLMLSGVGPKQALARHGITPVADLQGVGRNLQDHLDVTVMIRDRSKQAIGVAPALLPRAMAGIWEYWSERKGLLTSNFAETGGFAKLSPRSAVPEIQFHFLPTYLRNHGRTVSPGYGATLHLCQLRPKSRGFIDLKSADPLAAPLIDPCYLSHPDDMDEMLRGLKLARRVFEAEAFQAVNGGEVAPGPGARSDDDLRAYVRRGAETIYHPVGSCKMGHDDMAVVDSSLRVHGLTGLRVADASIMPTLIGGNTNAPSMVIGEMCARAILARSEPQMLKSQAHETRAEQAAA